MGKSPAMSAWGAFDLVIASIPGRPLAGDSPRPGEYVSRAAIAPGDVFRLTAELGVPSPDRDRALADLAEGRARLFAVGRVHYGDAFHSDTHVTDFPASR